MSLTNTDPEKTKWFPKIRWTRVINPKITQDLEKTIKDENQALGQMKMTMQSSQVAAVIFETIQGEGGDNHFRSSFFKEVRSLCDQYKVMFILDEVQCGMGLTGKWWAYERMGVTPDMICFGKKSQVCGFASTRRIEEAPEHVFKKSGRINSTWGGNFVDMERARLIIEVIKERRLVEHAATVGEYFLKELESLSGGEVTNVRGKGLMLAFDLPTNERRDEVIHDLHENGLLALKSGSHSIRFRPALTFSLEDVHDAIHFIKKTLG
jgi:L-lysine 6-transaminase